MKTTRPTSEHRRKLIEPEDTLHYHAPVHDTHHLEKIVEVLESRGATFGEDYIVEQIGTWYKIHCKDSFISVWEDEL